MDCPKCDGKTGVLETREQRWRRRRCKVCSHQFFTTEVIIDRPRSDKPGPVPNSERISQPKAAKAAKPAPTLPKGAERKPLPAPEFTGRESMANCPTVATERVKTSVPAFSFALKMPPGAEARLRR